MSGSSRSRSKHKLEPISLEELAGTTGMSGFCSFLTRDSSVAVPALDQFEPAPQLSAPGLAFPPALQTGAPELDGAPDLAALSPTAPGPTLPVESESSALALSAPPLGAFESAALASSVKPAPQPAATELGVPEESAPYLPRRRTRIREVTTVQDGHSLAEQAVYEAMYRAGRPYRAESRILTIGLRTLAEISRMAYSNCKANVRSLAAKLAIDERPGFSYVDGRTYIIYGFAEILERRKAAGLTHVIRTRGVAFVNPVSGRPVLEPGAGDLGAPETGALEYADQQTIIEALRQYIPEADENAALDLWRRCLTEAPNATVAEVVHFMGVKAGKPGMRMPLGFLLAAVPKCFQSESLRQFREQRAGGGEDTGSRERAFAAELLRSPDSDDEQRQWAREVLGLRVERAR